MKFAKLCRSLWLLSLACVVTSGCSQAALHPVLAPRNGQSSVPSVLPGGAAARLHTPASPNDSSPPTWMLPEAATEDLIYISTLHDVKVYSYASGRHVGTLKGFFSPNGECVDGAGNIFIANQDTIVEYRHGHTKRLQTLTMPQYVAVDCSVDPITGNLAVTWNQSASSENYVAIYAHASGSPTLYGLNGDFVFYCGYDKRGNLFADGQVGYESQEALFFELPHGGAKLQSLTLNQSFEHVGAVQWDGKYVAIGDDEAEKIYRFAISGSSGTLEGTVSLDGLSISYQWWIFGRRILVPDTAFIHYNSVGEVRYYAYPKGGLPLKTISVGNDTAPYGVTVSLAPH